MSLSIVNLHPVVHPLHPAEALELTDVYNLSPPMNPNPRNSMGMSLICYVSTFFVESLRSISQEMTKLLK
jgi:hypothetical protein